MNERIKLLAEKADLCFIGHDDKLTSHFDNFADMDKEVLKFAELIVKECAGIYDKIDNGNLHLGTDNYLEAIHKHFGVD